MERKIKSHKLRIFLCHSSDDKPIVRELYKRLCRDRFEPWLDEKDLLPGQDWQQEILKAMRSSDVTIVCLSPGSIIKKGYVQKEIRYALNIADKQREGIIFIIPLKLEECETPEQLKRWHWGSYYERGGYEQLRKVLRLRASALEKIHPSVDTANRSTVEQGLKRYLSVYKTASWMFISALLISLLVVIYLHSKSSSIALALPMILDVEFLTDGIQIRNTSYSYPVVIHEVYPIVYKVNEARFRRVDRRQMRRANEVGQILEPKKPTPEANEEAQISEEKQITIVSSAELMSHPESTLFETPPTSDETIIWALVIIYSHVSDPNLKSYADNLGKISGESWHSRVSDLNLKRYVRVGPFFVPDVNEQKIQIFGNRDKVSVGLINVMRDIEKDEINRFIGE